MAQGAPFYTYDYSATDHYVEKNFRTDLRDADVEILQFDDVLTGMLRNSPGWLNFLGMGETVDSIEYRWFEADPFPGQITLGEELDAGGTPEAGLTVTAGEEEYFTVGEVWIDLDAPSEYLVVADINKSTHEITFTREAYGTTKVIHAQGNTLRRMDKPLVEDSEPDVSRVIMPHYCYNVIETFDRYIRLPRHVLKTKIHAISDFLAFQVEQATLDVKDDLAYATLYGAFANPVRGNATVARRMRGLYGMLTATTDADGNTITPNLISAARTFGKDLVNEMEREIDDRNGGGDTGTLYLLCNPVIVDAAQDIWEEKVWITRTDTVRGTQVKSIIAKRGHTIEFVPDKKIPAKHLFMLNKSKISLHPFVGANWVLEPYSKISDGERYRLMGDYTLKVKDTTKEHCLATTVSVPA